MIYGVSSHVPETQTPWGGHLPNPQSPDTLSSTTDRNSEDLRSWRVFMVGHKGSLSDGSDGSDGLGVPQTALTWSSTNDLLTDERVDLRGGSRPSQNPTHT